MKLKVPAAWQEQTGDEGGAKPKEGLALLLDNSDPTGASALHLASMMMAPTPAGLELSREGELQRSIGYVLDASPNCVSASAKTYTFVHNNGIDIESVQTYIQQRLEVLCSEDESGYAFSHEDLLAAGKVGPPVVQMQRGRASGDIRFDSAGLVLESLSNFSSARANACVYKGKWMYEATLGTAGIQQLGWATLNCPFTNEEGVGDAPDSYAIDGKRIRKWSGGCQQYGQAWMPGDVIGCCIDLEEGEITFWRNGVSLGVAFSGVRRLQHGLGYFPALSLSHGERCELNFGSHPFEHPVKGYLPFQAPPLVTREDGSQSESQGMESDQSEKSPCQGVSHRANYLLGCLQRLVQLHSLDLLSITSSAEIRRKPDSLRKDDQVLVASTLCSHLGPLLLAGGQPCSVNRSFGRREEARPQGGYVVWGPLLLFLLNTLRRSPPHDCDSLELALDLLLVCLDQHEIEGVVPVLLEAVAHGCRTAVYKPDDPTYSGPYPYLALACRLVRRREILQIWWASRGFESAMEGLLTRKSPNKNDLEELFPVVWWPGCREEACSEVRMKQAAQALAAAIAKVEELQVDLCRQLLAFVPPRPVGTTLGAAAPSSAQGGAFGAFLQGLIRKNRGANRNVPPPGLSDNSVLVSAFFVLLRILSEGLAEPPLAEERSPVEWTERTGPGYLRKGGERKFPVSSFLRSDALYMDLPRLGGTFSHLSKTLPVSFPQDYADVRWNDDSDEDDAASNEGSSGSREDREWDAGMGRAGTSWGAGPARVSTPESSGGGLGGRYGSMRNRPESEAGQAGTSERGGGGDEGLRSTSDVKPEGSGRSESSEGGAREEELVDMLVLLYHLGVASNFKQASLYLQNQMQSINQLDDADRQIRASKGRSDDHIRHLREARNVYREDVIDNVRHCTWYRVSLFSKWKQEGIYSTCVWIVQLLLASSQRGLLFSYVPEFYVETLVDSFHALRRSDPPFAPPASLLRRGLSSLVTFLVAHFNDVRIANPDVRDVLLQSISVLLQYREYVAAFERNAVAREQLPAALLTAFDNRFWIPVSHILLRLCKGSAFGGARMAATNPHASECSSAVFQELLRLKCEEDAALLATFVNRLFNTLNWTITEFSVTVKEMQDHEERRQVPELQQRKCSIMFELSCNLLRILEFLAGQLPHVFLRGPEMNLTRLCELLLFVLGHTTMGPDAALFDSAQRLPGASSEKLKREAILGPLVGILLNLGGEPPQAQAQAQAEAEWDITRAIAHVDSSPTCLTNFEYLVTYNWSEALRGDPSLARLPQLRTLVRRLRSEVEAVRHAAQQQEARRAQAQGQRGQRGPEEEGEAELCSICYANDIDTTFVPCKHRSCRHCISRHLLNNSRCFFCNAAVEELSPPSSSEAANPVPVEMPIEDELGHMVD